MKELNSELTYTQNFLYKRFKRIVSVILKPIGDIRIDNEFKVVFDYEILPKIAMFFLNMVTQSNSN